MIPVPKAPRSKTVVFNSKETIPEASDARRGYTPEIMRAPVGCAVSRLRGGVG